MYFFLPLIAHVLAGLSSVIIGIVAFVAPKRRGRHPRWGRYYLWTYSLVFLSATILSFEHWQKDSYLFYTALVSYGLVLIGFTAGQRRRNAGLSVVQRKRWLRVHILGMIGSYIGLLTAFLVDNGDQIPFVNSLPVLAFWFIPGIIGLPFLVRSLLRYTPLTKNVARLPGREKEAETVSSAR
jgi:hypothetical protein